MEKKCKKKKKWKLSVKTRFRAALHHPSSSVCIARMELHPCTVRVGAGVHIWVGERIGRSLLLLLCHHHHLLLLLLLLLLLEHEGMLLLLHGSHLIAAGCGYGIGGVERVVHRLLHHWT